jgi:ABC-2 type transport system permease protein
VTVTTSAPGGGRAIEARLFPSTWKLLRLQLRIWVNGFRRGKVRDRIGRVLVLLFLGGLMVFVFFASRALLGFIRSPAFLSAVPNMPLLAESLPVLVMGAAFVGILLTSFGVLLQALYLSGDMDFLLTAPVPIRAVFLSKLLQAIVPNFGLICLLALPLLFGLGSAEHYNAAFYPLVVFSLAALALAAAGVAGVLVMGIVHFFPARRAAEILGFVGALITILCSQSGQFARMSNLSEVQLQQAALVVSRFDLPWSPLSWAGRGLVHIGQGDWVVGAGMLMGMVVFCCAVFLAALIAAERLYYSGWASVSVASTRKRRPGAARRSAGAVALRARARTGRGSPLRAIVVKDFAMLRRDLRNLSAMVTPIIMGVVYAILLVRGGGEPPPGRGEAPEWFMQGFRDLLVFGDIGISLFVGWVLSSRLATMGFSQEGRSWWILKTAPIGPTRLLTAKYIVAYLPVAVLGGGFLIVLSIVRSVALGDVVFGLLVVALCYAAMTGVNLAFGVLGANFQWEDPRRMVRGTAGCLSTIASVAVLGNCLVFFVAPVFAAPLLGLPALVGKVVGLALGTAACAACALVPPALVQNRVPRLGE